MTTSCEGLPRFKKPPVVETVLGVFFRPSKSLTSAHLGVFWDRFLRKDFPRVEERPPADEARERFGDERLISAPPVRWKVLDRPEVPRLWATSDDGEHVVQLQRNALLANWLKKKDGPYLRYSDRRQEFARRLTELEQFFREEGFGPLEPTSCLVTYVNLIQLRSLEKMASELARVLTCCTNPTSDGWLPEPDKVMLNLGFPFPQQQGRLNVQVVPIVRREDRQPMLRLELTARGPLQQRTVAEAMSWIDMGHEWVVRGFTSLTRPEMHEEQAWERIR